MKKFDIVVLTESRYLNPDIIDAYTQNVLDEDNIVMQALQATGHSVSRVDWADKNFNWCSTQMVLFRSTWDYFDRFEEFQQWLTSTKELVHFINPIELILWNLDKHYLIT